MRADTPEYGYVAMNAGLAPPFMPHGMCYLWNSQLLFLHIVSDGGIALAYFSIPLVLAYFVKQRRDLPFKGLFAMFGAFIIFCGVTHIMAIVTIWDPLYWLDGGIKAATAAISLATAAVLAPLIPKALTLRSLAQLERLNVELQGRVDGRERSLIEAEEQFRSLVEALPLIVWTANAAGEVVFFNQRWSDYTGMTVEQSLGWGWEPVLHPEDSQRCVELWQQSIAHGAPFEMELRFKRAGDGAYRWFLGRALPLRDAGDTVVKWFGTCTDIDAQKLASEAAGRFAEQVRLNERLQSDIRGRAHAEAALRASEERYQQVEEHAPIGLALVAFTGEFTRVNPALCSLLGYTREELLHMTFAAITHPDDRAMNRAYVRAMIDGTSHGSNVTNRFVHKGGNALRVLVSGSLVRDGSGEPGYFIVQIADISEKEAAKEALQSARDAALAGTEAKSRFIATMSHEIRTPMHGIIGMTELLLLTQLTAEQDEYVNVVRDSGRNLLRVLNDILDYSKIEAGKLELDATEFELTAVVKSVVELLKPQFVSKDVSLTTELDPQIAHAVNGDADRLRQVLFNLVGNALKFTPHGGTVSILGTVGAKADLVRFSVVDTGIGISAEATRRLFKPFSQADGSTTREYGGTGLGLSICAELVTLMHGTIGVESTPGKGSSFWFEVTLRRASGPVTRVSAAPAPARQHTGSPRVERILLVEDNEINTLLARKQFKQLGFDVTAVVNGRQSVEAIAGTHFDLVFMDLSHAGHGRL